MTEVSLGSASNAPGSEIVARSNKEDLKALFYVLAGKPDSVIKVFPRPAIVEPKDLYDLNDRISEKLAQHHVFSVVVTATIAHDKNLIKEFAWSEFAAHKWNGAETTKSASLRWDFMVQLPGYQVPQRHTLTLRISGERNPMDMLEVALSKDADKASRAETEFAPMFCRVDFINALLSEELINIVVAWHAALPKPAGSTGFWPWLRKHDHYVIPATHVMAKMIGVAVCLIVGGVLLPTDLSGGVTPRLGVQFAAWLLTSLAFIEILEMIGHFVGQGAASALDRSNRHVALRFTRGDINRESELAEANRKSIRNVAWRLGGAFALDVAFTVGATWIATRVLSGSGS